MEQYAKTIAGELKVNVTQVAAVEALLGDGFVKDPAEIVKVRQQITARVLEVDRQRGRIALSLRDGR